MSWAHEISAYLSAQAASGYPSTTRYTRRQHLEHLARRVEAGPWTITHDELTSYIASQQWARETLRGRVGTFRSFYAWALSTGRTLTDPTDAIDRVRPSAPNPQPVPDRVYHAALLHADADEMLWIDLAAEHGLRRAEIARIHSDDLIETLVGWDLHVHGKGDKPRNVPLTRAMARALADRPHGYAFPGGDHGHISARWLGKRVNRLLEGQWTIHKLRHRAATRFWSSSEGDPYVVADLMGWANLSMVRVYVAIDDARRRAVVEGASRTGGSLSALPRAA